MEKAQKDSFEWQVSDFLFVSGSILFAQLGTVYLLIILVNYFTS